jgi:hypothetical protein
MSGIKKWGWWFSKSLVKLKNPPCPLGKGESPKLNFKQIIAN